MKPHTTAIVILAAAALAGVAIWSATSEKSTVTAGSEKPILPGLSDKAASVSWLTVKRAKGTFTVAKDAEGAWRMRELADYPVKADAVSQIILGLSQLTEWEPKTTRPDMYSKIGVEDPGAPVAAESGAEPGAGPSQSTLLTLKDASGAVVAEIIVGNRKWGQTQSQYGTYVRRVGDSQSWLAHGQFDAPSEQILWMDAQFSNIDRARVKSVSLTHPGADPMVISRDNDKGQFTLRNLPAGRELKDPGVPESIATALAFCSFQDVAKAGPDFSGASDVKPGPMIEFRTFDGLVVNENGLVKGGKQWWSLVASADESVISANAANAPDAEKAKAEGEKIRKEVQTLNAKWAPWIFAPVDFKSRAMNNTMDDLIKPLPTPPPAAAPTAEPAPAVPAEAPKP